MEMEFLIEKKEVEGLSEEVRKRLDSFCVGSKRFGWKKVKIFRGEEKTLLSLLFETKLI